MLVGLVRLGAAARDVELPQVDGAGRPAAGAPRAPRALCGRTSSRACSLTRAPLAPALATTRRPDLSLEEPGGLRHDLFRIPDYAQHVELQGLVKNAEVVLARGSGRWETARELEADPGAAKLPGARYKLCAVLDRELSAAARASVDGRRRAAPADPVGLFGVSLEDPVY